MPQFTLHQTELWAGQDTSIAYGVSFEAERFDPDDFRPRVVLLPLATVKRSLHYSFSAKLFASRNKGLWHWSPDEAELILDEIEAKVREHGSMLEAGTSPERFCDWLRSTGRTDSNANEALGQYSIYAGRIDEAFTALRAARDAFLSGDDRPEWQDRRGRDAASLISLLEQDESEAIAWLDQRCQVARVVLEFVPKAA